MDIGVLKEKMGVAYKYWISKSGQEDPYEWLHEAPGHRDGIKDRWLRLTQDKIKKPGIE